MPCHADRLDTERFCDEQKACVRNSSCLAIPEMLRLFDRHMRQKFGDLSSEKGSPMNTTRKRILESCIARSGLRPGMFKLTVPTGCGKTLSSMAFALNHAVANSLDRIIYAIPYTSIIEQNAQVFREIFGDPTCWSTTAILILTTEMRKAFRNPDFRPKIGMCH